MDSEGKGRTPNVEPKRSRSCCRSPNRNRGMAMLARVRLKAKARTTDGEKGGRIQRNSSLCGLIFIVVYAARVRIQDLSFVVDFFVF